MNRSCTPSVQPPWQRNQRSERVVQRRIRLGWVLCTALVQCLCWSPRHAQAIPAFARKYGLACTGCHEAWPALNDVGRAFRDNGYQMMLGMDEPTKSHPGYWPVSIRVTPHYEYNSADHQETDQGPRTLGNGGIVDIGMDLLTAGTLAKNASFLVVVAGFSSDEAAALEAAWVRFDNLGGSGWLNVKIGKHEVDLPRSGHRTWGLTEPGYLIYAYHSPGSISAYDMAENQRGIELAGHDRASFSRVSLSIFNVGDSPGSSNAFDTPGAYGRLSHKWLFAGTFLSATRIGAFGSYTTWPTTFQTEGGEPIPGTGGHLKKATKYGLDWNLWFGPSATPFRAILVGVHGSDSRDLIPGATRDGTFNGGFLEIGYTPTLKNTLFGRADIVRNQEQGDPSVPKTFDDQDEYTFGVRHTIAFNSRAEYALHAEYSTSKTRNGAFDGSDLRTKSAFVGVDFAY